MRRITLLLALALLPACGRAPAGQPPAAVLEESEVGRLAEDLNLLAGKYAMNVDTMMRLFHDYAAYTGGHDFKKELAKIRAFQKQEAYLDDELDQVLDVPNALRLISQKYNISESVIASMILDYRTLAVCR
ncbi:MAG TPA: hypothetical protein PLB05_02880 [Candidatus Omnitrophota bacterium]|nr:hypothetical protein [Candidatus Omnitrophota bacterium]HPN56260.1 hypothetical protein [Candidatus Omnitrophota bacterium]